MAIWQDTQDAAPRLRSVAWRWRRPVWRRRTRGAVPADLRRDVGLGEHRDCGPDADPGAADMSRLHRIAARAGAGLPT
jgi:hypothetical protein